MDRMRLINRPEGCFYTQSFSLTVADSSPLMRELHATNAILRKAILKAREDDAAHITKLHLAIGEIAEFDQNAIQQHWNDLSKGTPAEGAQLHFRVITAEVQCMSCFRKYQPEDGKILCSN